MSEGILRFWRGAVAITAALVAMGCGGNDGGDTAADQPATAEEAPAVTDETVPMDTDFASELGVNLDRMTRSESGLYYIDLDPGSGLAAREGHVLDTHYTGWLTTGTEFGSSRGGAPYRFQLGRQQVPRGFEEGVTGMRIGGVRKIVVPPSLAYGSRGQPPTIPPSATLVYEIELLDIEL